MMSESAGCFDRKGRGKSSDSRRKAEPTFFLPRRIAPRAKLPLTITGSNSGMSPTATEMEKTNAACRDVKPKEKVRKSRCLIIGQKELLAYLPSCIFIGRSLDHKHDGNHDGHETHQEVGNTSNRMIKRVQRSRSSQHRRQSTHIGI